MKPLLIIKTGGTFAETIPQAGDFEDWTRRGLGIEPGQVRVVAVHLGETLPDPREVGAAVVTGSHAMVTDGDGWIDATGRWLRDAVDGELPVLGICFGHQLLADALGGRADWNPLGREIGTVDITLTPAGRGDRLLGLCPPAFPAHVTHRQSAVVLPPGAVLLASSELDPHQAFRFGSAWGVQFHPEFTADDVRYYIERLHGEIATEGGDPGRLLAGVRPTPEATAVLGRFAALVRSQT